MSGFPELYDALGKAFLSDFRPDYTAAAARVGQRYSHGLMVIGRAVNGWGLSVELPELSSSGALWKKAQTDIPPAACSMQWVRDKWGARKQGDYSTARSAFWRVSKGILEGLAITPPQTEDWPSHLAWSNLYKLAPAETGNPPWKICELQHAACLAILREEIVTFQPRYILMMTGMNWARPFLEYLGAGADTQHSQQPFIEASGILHLGNYTGRFAVTCRPERQNTGQFVSAVVRAYNSA